MKLSDPFDYENDYNYSLNDPISFWDEVSKKYVYWDKAYDKVYNFNSNTNKSEWFQGGLLNTCYNALDKNILNGKQNEIAFVYEVPIEKLRYEITYQQLYDKVCLFSRGLKNLGVKKGDVVFIYMHNCFETIISMLSCSRIGAIHNLYNDCTVDNLSDCIDECKPTIIITSNYGYFIKDSIHHYSLWLKEALKSSSHKPNHTVVYNRNDIKVDLDSVIIDNSIDWYDLIKDIEPLKEWVPVESDHPLYIIYTSGTSSKPKGIIRNTGGHIIQINYAARNFLKLDSYCIYGGANFSWISAHSFLLYGSMFSGGKSVFIEGPFTDPCIGLWDIVSRNKINVFLMTPYSTRVLSNIDPDGKIASQFDLSSIKFVYSGSEKVYQQGYDYLIKVINKPILIDYWQTESGSHLIFNPFNQIKVRGSSIGKPAPGGYQIKVVSKLKSNPSEVIELKANEIGEIVIKLPLPPGFTTSIFNDDENSTIYNQNYLNQYKGYYATGDLGYYDEDGYFYYCSRAGDSITTGSSSVNCSVLECEILNNIQKISECCLIGIKDEMVNEIPLALLVLKNQNEPIDQIEFIKSQVLKYLFKTFQTCINNPIYVIVVKNLPKNRNGKTLKPLIKSIFNDSFITSSENEDINKLIKEKRNFELIKIKNQMN